MVSASRRSATGRSLSGSIRQKVIKEKIQKAVFLRGVDQSILKEDSSSHEADDGLRVSIDHMLLDTSYFRNVTYVSVSLVSSYATESLQKSHAQDVQNPEMHAFKVIAKVTLWEEAPSPSHVLLSNSLSKALGSDIIVGSIIRLEKAPPALAQNLIKSIRIHPFDSTSTTQTDIIKFGGETRASRDEAASSIRSALGSGRGNGLLAGPLTDGLVLPKLHAAGLRKWHGGVLRFEYDSEGLDYDRKNVRWIDGLDDRVGVQVLQEILNPLNSRKEEVAAISCLPIPVPSLIGVTTTVDRVTKSLLHGSSVLLTGGIGSGKSSIASKVGHALQTDHFFHISIFHCRRLLADDIRVSTITDVLEKVFNGAVSGSRLGGRSVVVVDDLDMLCPAETELQVGGENGRARHLSELFASLTHHTKRAAGRTTVLITAHSKEALHRTIVAGHVIQETVDLKAPNKDVRRQILEALIFNNQGNTPDTGYLKTLDLDGEVEERLTDQSVGKYGLVATNPSAQLSFQRDANILEIAGATDGYMPGDLITLHSRAKSEALTRLIKHHLHSANITLTQEDFTQALHGFTPASLRNVTLHSSSTRFDSVGGLHNARKVLMETLQYPTMYAPIFDRCPLRLRSGLLLYGYPGCGKTLLASAVAGECGLNFISVKGPEILNKYIGASEKSVRDLFERAEAAKPCVLFFDEFDSIAPKRGHDSTGVTDRVVNQLLTQMDGAEGLSGVYVLAATSRPDLIDPALLRPGRLDKSLICDMPSLDERFDILRAVSKDLSVDDSILGNDGSKHTLWEVAGRTEGYTGADLQAIMYNAHLEAIHSALDEQVLRSTKPNPSGKHLYGSRKQQLSRKEYIQFRFGKDDEDSNQKQDAYQHNAQLQALQGKLDAMKIAKRKERQRRLEKQNPRMAPFQNVEEESDIKICWNHIESSLASTRSSMNVDERRKLDRIYRDFVTARDGDMPSGQGPTEVGARSSLM